jgi:uncharacterized protein YqgC (DUF456 family)
MLPLVLSDSALLTIYWILVAVMVVGVIGAIVPALPGMALVSVAILIWALVAGFTQSTVIPLVVAVVLLLISIGIDFLAGYLGAKYAGASQWGQIGAIVGLILGLLGLLPTLPIGGPIGPIVGIIFGSVAGAAIGEFLYRRDVVQAVKAAIGIVVGSVVGKLLQFVLALVTLVVFFVRTWPYAS